jgi:hypothetical protein
MNQKNATGTSFITNTSEFANTFSNNINLFLFTFLLITTIVMAVILHFYNRHRHGDQLNVLVLLQTYLTDSVLLFTLSMIIPVLIRLTIGSMSHILAEVFMMIIYITVCLLIILTAANSLMKLLLVTNFGLIFGTDPRKLAWLTLMMAILLACLPNMFFTSWVIFVRKQCASTITVAYFMNYESVESRISLGAIYMLICLLISLLLLGLVVCWIPRYLKKAHSSVAIRKRKHFQAFLISLQHV